MSGRSNSGRIATVLFTAAVAMTVVAAEPTKKQMTFSTPEEAANALIAAAEIFDVAALTEILGPDGVDLVVTEDAVQDRNQSAAFAANAREKTQVVRDAANSRRAVLVTGLEEWPMPIPIVEKKGRWSFDTRTGRTEILYRRIGHNELDAIEVCRGFVEAQHDYALTKHDGAAVNQYAQKIISTAGKRDGLAWLNDDGTWGGPVGEAIARVIAEGHTSKFEPYHGYYFKVLKGQGKSAPLGAMDFVVEGAMLGGFALVAAPADYAVTGVTTFIVSHDGIVFEKDLGKKTLEQFLAMELYDPDKSWRPVAEP